MLSLMVQYMQSSYKLVYPSDPSSHIPGAETIAKEKDRISVTMTRELNLNDTICPLKVTFTGPLPYGPLHFGIGQLKCTQVRMALHCSTLHHRAKTSTGFAIHHSPNTAVS